MKLKKIGAIVLALVMVLMMSSTAFADTTLTDGEAGGSSTFATDNPASQDKTLKIAKELKVYNVNETSINAPTVSYTYALSAGDANVSITDATSDHANSTAVQAYTKAGITPASVTLTGTAANTIAWTPAETVTAATDGAANIKYLTLDFSSVVFGAPGVYRYVLTETAPNYAAAGVTETTANVNKHVRYIDVYVRAATSGFNNGSTAAEWDIYGYVCLLESEEITDAGDTTTTGAVKTNGFVSGTNDGTAYLADQYYTFNVTVSKTVTNDAYAAATHSFPFSVLFTNANVTNEVDISSTVTSTAGGFTDPASGVLSSTKGVVTIKSGSSVKYIGIPNGTQVEVYETNDVTGVTYQVSTTKDTDVAVVDQAVVWGTAPSEAVTQTTKADYESTKAILTTTADADDDINHTIAVVNNLQLISPTGVVLRFAPYMLILIGGIALLVVAKKHKKHTDEE